MEARYAFRKTPLLEACQVALRFASRFFHACPPLAFVSKTCHGQVATQPAHTDVCSLLSDLERQNVEAMADRLAQSRLPLPGCLGCGAWDKVDGVGSIRSFLRFP